MAYTSLTLRQVNTEENNGWIGWSLAVITIFDFSTLPIAVKIGITLGLSPTVALTVRNALALLLITGTILFTAPKRLRPEPRLLFFAVLGGLAYAANTLLYSWSLVRLDTSIAALLFALFPLAVLGLLALRGEKFTRRNLVRVGLGVAGVFLLIGPGEQVHRGGVLMVLVSVFLFALYYAILQWTLKEYDSRTVTIYVLLTMTIATGAFGVFQGTDWSVPGLNGWLLIIWLGGFGTYLTQLTVMAAVRRIGSGQLALFSPLETLLTVLWSVLFLSDFLTPLQWIGSSFIVASALLAVQRWRRVRPRPRWRTWSRL